MWGKVHRQTQYAKNVISGLCYWDDRNDLLTISLEFLQIEFLLLL